MSKERNTVQMLWDMVDAMRDSDKPGQIVSRYASFIDDRIENSGYSHSVDSLKLYSTEQLEDELESRGEL